MKSRFFHLSPAFILALVPTHALISCAQTPPQSVAATQTPFSLLPLEPLGAFKIGGPRVADAQVAPVTAQNPEFKQAIQVRTLKQPAHPYDIQLAARNTAPIRKGDVLLASFWMRTVESPMLEGFVGFTFEQAGGEYIRSFGHEVSAGTSWKRFDFPFKSVGDYAPGEAVMNLRVGFAPQVIELAGVSLLDYGPNYAIETLPATRLTYAASEPDAPWRKEAAARIEKIRKGELQITVRDAAGKPIPGAEITVKQTRSAFPFGSAVNAKALISSEPADLKYQEMVKKHFNRIVFENDLKARQWKADRETPQKALQWLREANIEARGHVLVWPSWRHSSPDLKALENDPPVLRGALNAHIADVAGTLRGQLHDWDVLNEPYKNHDIIDLLEPSIQAEWFREARKADPDAKLYLNDYGILESGGKDLAHQQHFEDTIAFLIREKAPIDGIGIQGHFGSDLTPPTKMLAILDRFSKFGLPIQITEFDTQLPNETLQGEFTRDFLTTMFSHPNVNGVVMWGFWEGRHYAPIAALWRRDWTPKPNALAWMDLVDKEWRTNVLAKSGANGAFKTHAFLGDYEISVSFNGKSATQKVSLNGAGETKAIEFNLP